jgi:4-amino-4-deoxy-L-arabinose transferase-like glycosyltransferase
VLSDSLFLFFFVCSFYLALKSLMEAGDAIVRSVGAGVCGGLAYLTRPEGMAIIIFLVSYCLFEILVSRRGKQARVFLIMGFLLLSFSLIAAPYPLFIKLHTGRWHISMKPSIVKSFETPVPEPERKSPSVSLNHKLHIQGAESLSVAPAKLQEPFRKAEFWKSLTHPPLKFIETYHYLLFLFLIIGIWAGYKHETESRGGILLVVSLGYLLGLCYLYHTVSYVSRRHFLPPITLSLPIAAIGLWEVRERLSCLMSRLHYRWNTAAATHATVVVLLITLLTLAPKALKSQEIEKLPLKEAALWIKENSPKPCPVIMCNEPLVAYYAGGKHLPIPGMRYKEFVQYISAKQVHYVVFEERDIKSAGQFLSQLQPERFRKIPLKEEGVLVYEVM